MRAVLLPVLLCAMAAWAEDWPMARGNLQATGVSSSKLPDNPELLWTLKTTEAIKGSPVIAAGVVYIGCGDRKVYALKLADGSKLWEFEALDRIESTPCVHEGVVYIGSNDTHLYALDAASGKKKWEYKTEDTIKAPPIVVGGKVVVGSYDNKLHCVDAASGKGLWTIETQNFINAPVSVSEKQIVVGGCDGYLYVADLEQGKLIGKVPVGPTVDGKPVESAYISVASAIRGKVAYVGHYEAEFVAIDLDKLDIKWRFRNKRVFPFFSGAALHGERIVVGARDKRLHCLNAADGKQQWEFLARGQINSSPVICGDRVVFGCADHRIYIVSLESGKQLWSYEAADKIESSPAVSDGIFVIGCDDGMLYAFGAKK